MAFVHEFISDSEQSFFEKYDLPIWHDGTWTLDRERDAYFIYIKTEIYDGIFSEYCLIFNGEKIRIQIERQAMCEMINEKEARFTGIIIESVTAPKKLKPYCDEITALVKEAFSEEFRWTLRKDEPPFEKKYKIKILRMARSTFGFRELHENKVILIKIEHYTRDVMLFGLALSEDDVRKELADVERMRKADPNAELASLMHKKYGWGVVDMDEWNKTWKDEIPDWIYDHDTGLLYAPKG